MALQRTLAFAGRGCTGAAIALAFATLLWLAPVARSQQPAPPEPEADRAAPAGPVDDYERGVPRSAVHGYLTACRSGDFERAAAYLDLRPVPEPERAERGPELARQLKVVLDRALWVDLEALSNEPQGMQDDGLPANRDLLGIVEASRGPERILLERVPRPDGVRIWKISAATVAEVPALYDEFGYGQLERYLPQFLLDFRVAEVALWQWIGLLVAIALAYAVSLLIASVLVRVGRTLVGRSSTRVDDRMLDAAVGPLRLGLAVLAFHVLVLPLGLALPVRRFFTGAEKALAIYAVAWMLFRLIDVLSRLYEERLVSSGNAPAANVLPLGRKAVKAVIALVAFLAALDNFGFDVTAMVAGLGVGGIAVALAAQKTVENLFGGITLIADRPVRPGDFCRFGDNVGTVEEIGLRSTRVRTLDRTLVTIPNAEFSTLKLENFAERDRIRFFTVLGLRYETTPDQLRHVLIEIRRMLLSHPRVTPEPARVRFIAFGAYSLDLEIFAYVDTSDWSEFLAVREDLLLRLMDIVDGSGSGFAFPSQTSYLARDDGLDAEKTRLAEEEIRALRERRSLPLPDYAEEVKSGFKDSLDYPPRGSTLRRD